MSGTPANGLSIALLGSGEVEPSTEEVDRWLLGRATGYGTVLILPAASAPEGDAVFDRWAEMGLLHYTQLGVPAEVVPLKTGADAERPELSAKLATASMAYFSGGNPAYLAGVLQGSLFWEELLAAVRRGWPTRGAARGSPASESSPWTAPLTPAAIRIYGNRGFACSRTSSSAPTGTPWTSTCRGCRPCSSPPCRPTGDSWPSTNTRPWSATAGSGA